MRNIYSSAIIGCGKIGAFYSKAEDKKGLMTHAHAYKKDPRVNISAFMDINLRKAKKAAEIWGGNAYNSLDKMFKKEKIDIISICAPDEFHEDILSVCLKYKPKAVFCEKPFTLDTKSAERMVKSYRKADILLAVNYTRRYKKSVIKLKKEIEKNTYGKVLNISGIYTKGVLHNGSHLIDTLRYLFGEIDEIMALSGRFDWNKNDPTIDAFFRFDNGIHAHILGGDERRYSIFEIDILFEKARICLEEFGNKMVIYRPAANKRLHGYNELKPAGSYELNKCGISNAVTNLINAIDGKDELICSGKHALATQKICCKLLEEYKKMRFI